MWERAASAGELSEDPRPGGVGAEFSALARVVDRLSMGVILLDSRQRPVWTNRAADEIAALDDGFRIDRERPRASDPREDRALRTLIASALEGSRKTGIGQRSLMSITRPSGERSFMVMVTSFPPPPAEGTGPDVAASLFVSDPRPQHSCALAALQSIYSLTRAEAELVGLLAEGLSLEEAAAQRGVTLNTVRSQLKQAFWKTDTGRQAELIQLVLKGVGTLRDE